MGDLVTLETIKNTATKLDGCGLTTLEDLRSWVSKDIDKSLTRLTESSDTAPSLLIALVIAEFGDDAGRSDRKKLGTYWRGLKPFPGLVKLYWIDLGETWKQKKLGVVPRLGEPSRQILRQLLTRHNRFWYNWRRHWADALLLIVLPVLLIGVWFRVESVKNSGVQFVVVKPSTNVGAFQRIGDEVELASIDNSSNAFTSVDQVRGRYSLVPLTGGTAVLSNQLLSAELSNRIQNHSILSIPLKVGTYLRGLSSTGEGVLILSPRETASVGSETASKQHAFEVILLSIDKIGDVATATVAIPAEDVDKAGALLATSDAYLSKAAR